MIAILQSRRFARLAALAVAAVVGLSALGQAQPAHAGTHGQQIQLCSSLWVNFGSAFVVGENQNGLVTSGPKSWVPWFDANGGRCNPVYNWWFKGTVTIHWYFSNGDYYRSSTCRIPTSQSSDWVSCIAPSGETGPFDSTYKG